MIIPVNTQKNLSFGGWCKAAFSALHRKVSACARTIIEKLGQIWHYLFRCATSSSIKIQPVENSSSVGSSPGLEEDRPLPSISAIDQKEYSSEEIESRLPYEVLPPLPVESLAHRDETDIPGEHCDPRNVVYTDVVDLVRDCVAKRDRNGLLEAARRLFIGPWGSPDFGGQSRLNIELLAVLLYDPQADLLDIGCLFLYAFKEWRISYRPPIIFPLFRTCRTEGTAALRQQYPNGFHTEDTMITISHGGSLGQIRRFLDRRSKGYKLENGDVVLQVSLNFRERDEYYANTRAPYQFDIPAVFSARINKQHVYYAPNAGYEGGLHTSKIDLLSNVEVRILPIIGNRGSWHSSVIEARAQKEWRGDLALAARVNKSIRRGNANQCDYTLLPFLNEERDNVRPIREDLRDRLDHIFQVAQGGCYAYYDGPVDTDEAGS